MSEKSELMKKELLPVLNRLWKDNGSIKGFRYFEDSIYKHSLSGNAQNFDPEVIVLGTGIPDVLLRAFPVRFRYLLGGSHTMMAWSDSLVPRDTDPLSRSLLGCIHASEISDIEKPLYLIPISCDSMRKIAYLLKEEGCKIFALDMPPDHADKRSVEKWEKQLIMMANAIAEHTHKHISLPKIKKAIRQINAAHHQLNSFMNDAYENCISGAGKMLIRNSYFFADDLQEWSRQLRILQKEANKGNSSGNSDDRPKILLTGSPICFPNYKVPFLIEDAGLRIRDYIDASTIKQNEFISDKGVISMKQALHRISHSTYKYEASAAYSCNDVFMRAVNKAINNKQVDGIIFHILKGQIEYDFELERMREMFEYYDIPVFRLETDYQDHDVEQLRIRLEAFCEMLTQTHFISAKKETLVFSGS